MISSINSTTMAITRSSSMQRPPPPPDQNVFQVADTNSDGLVSKAELETLVEGIEKVTGNSIGLDEALSSSDLDQDGSLSGEELLTLLNNSGFQPPPVGNNENGDTKMRPPPPAPPPPEQVLSAYNQNSGEDSIQQLLEYLQSQTDLNGELSSVDVSS